MTEENTSAKPDRTADDENRPGASDAILAVERAIGGLEKTFDLPDGTTFVVNAAELGRNIPPDSVPFIPLIPETLIDPYEIWRSFERNARTGQIRLRIRLIKAVQTERGAVGVVLVGDAANGRMKGYTFFRTEGVEGVNDYRRGQLLFGR